ncbi:ATP-binding protein [Pseudoclostridium thermosuccinogenes]|jgi:signal transduction histidine kinase|uniref:sensor histidine kinase n=1 Tax=Clostridium thermosuccinogenes TaxID=84032 RepID=UPI002FDB3DEC
MFRSIFSRLIFLFISLLTISFLITGAILYFFLGDFLSDEKVDLLERGSEEVSEAFEDFLQNPDSILVQIYLERIINMSSAYTDSIVWIVSKDGHIYFSSYMPQRIKMKYVDEKNGFVKLPDERQYKKIVSGQEQLMKLIGGDFYGFFRDEAFSSFGYSWLTVARPLRYTDTNGNTSIFGAVYFHTPIPEVQKARSTVIGYFTIAVAISALVSIVLAYLFSLRITRPLKQIKDAARIIAGGEFQKRLDIDTKDEIGQLATSFNQMAFELEHLEEMRRGFIANVSHELRTPMTSIRGFIEGILDGTIPPEKQKDYLVIVRDETLRLNRLVNDLLDLAKMQSGEIKLNFKTFNVNELVRRSIIKLENQIIEKDLEIHADFESEDILVYADPDAIERVMMNLLHNAIKFTGEKGKINIRIFRQKDKVLVSVQDNGVGIERDELDLIWERFYKSDKSRGMDKTGTGLGLAIIKNIINEHNQDIWVESEIGKGTKFTFTLEKSRGSES